MHDENEYVSKLFIYGLKNDFKIPLEILDEISFSRDIIHLKLDLKNYTFHKILDFFKPCMLSNNIEIARKSLKIY